MAGNYSLAVLFCIVILAGHSASVSSAAPTDNQNAPKVFMQTGHSASINAMALSPDGEWLAVGDMSGAIRIWDTSLRKETYRIGPLAMPVLSLAWGPDGKELFSGDAQGFRGGHDPISETTVGAWQPMRSGKDLWAIAVRPDGLIAMGGMDAEIVVERHREKAEPVRLPAGPGTRALAFSPDGSLLFSGNCETVRAWDTRDWTVRWEYKAPDCLYSIAATPDGSRLLASFGRFLAATNDPRIHVISARNGDLLGALEGAEGITTSIGIAPDGRTAVSATMAGVPTRILGWVPDHHVRIWNLDRMALIRTLKGHAGNVMAVAYSKDGRTIYSGSWDQTIRVWDLEGRPLAVLEGRARLPESALETSDGKFISTVFRDGSISFWDRVTGELSSHHPGTDRAEPFGRVLAAQSSGSGIQVIALPGLLQHAYFQAASATESFVRNRISAAGNWAKPDILAALEPERLTDGTPALVPEITAATISGNECWLSVSFTNTKSWRSASQLSRWACHTGSSVTQGAVFIPGVVTAFAISGDEKSVLVGRKEVTRQDPNNLLKTDERHLLSAHDVRTGKMLWERPVSAQVRRIALSQDGRTAFATAGFVIEVLDPSSGMRRLLLQGHNKSVSALAYHERAGVLASGSVDQTVVLWDVKTGKLLRRAYAHNDNVLSLAWSSIRKGDLISSSEDYTVRVANHDSRGEELVQLVQFGREDWAALSPEGYFAGSETGIEQLGFRVGPRLYTLDQLYDAFYRPDLIQRKLRGEGIARLAPATVARALETPPPEIRVDPVPRETGEESLVVRYEAIERGGGIGEIRVFHNGKLVRTNLPSKPLSELSAISLGQQTPAAVTRNLELRANAEPTKLRSGDTPLQGAAAGSLTIRPLPGINEISVLAFNGANNVQSRLKRVIFHASRPAAEPHVHAVAVGINRFKAAQWSLKYAAKDAADFISLVRAGKEALPAGKLGETRLLIDADATKAGILGALREMAVRTNPEDVFVLFLATHGIFEEDTYALITHDFDGHIGAGTTISASELLEALRKIPAQRTVLVADTCHAGGIDQTLSGFYDSRMKVLARSSGMHVLASAESMEGAIDGYKGNGLFTHVILNGVRSGEADLDRNRVISVLELGTYGRRNTSGIARSLGYIQVPVLMRVGSDVPIFFVSSQ